MKRYSRHTFRLSLLDFTVVFITFASSLMVAWNSGHAVADSSNNDRAGVNTHFPSVVTKVDDAGGELWACGVDKQVLALYIFLAPGTIPNLNPEHQLGIEIDPSRQGMANQRRYLWSMPNAKTVVMDMPDRGEKITWNNVVFTHADRISIESSDRGNMTCHKGYGKREIH